MAKFVVRPDVDILEMLKAKGHTSYTIRRDKTFGESTMHKLRNGGLPSWNELAKLVSLLRVSPVDLIAFQTDKGAIYDLTGKIRLDAPAPEPEHQTIIQHGHPGDDGYDPDDPGDQMPCDDDY